MKHDKDLDRASVAHERGESTLSKLAVPKCPVCGSTENLVNTIEDLPQCENCVEPFDPDKRKYDGWIALVIVLVVIFAIDYSYEAIRNLLMQW